MSIMPSPRAADDPQVIMAELDPAPDREELPWWMEQLRERAGIDSWGGQGSPRDRSPKRVTVQVQAPDDQFEAVARRLVIAVEEANAAYPDRYPAWRREHDARMAEERRRQERRRADHQAVLDELVAEYRSKPD
jgi:hypothetical protein